MEIIHKDGDIFKGSETFKVHQVNCKGAMGAGIAKQVRTDYPEVYEHYKKACNRVKNSSELLGKVQVIKTTKDFYIINLFAQDDYNSPTGRCTNYEAFYTGLEKIKAYVIGKNLPREVAFPCRIGSALAGGDWNVIYAMICSVFNNTDFKVAIYDFKR